MIPTLELYNTNTSNPIMQVVKIYSFLFKLSHFLRNIELCLSLWNNLEYKNVQIL
jgi:hypothetical protein